MFTHFIVQAAVALYGHLNADGLGIMYIRMEYTYILIRLSRYRSTYLYTYSDTTHIYTYTVQAAVALYGQLNADGLGMGTDRVDLGLTRG